MIELRPYQKNAVEAVEREFQAGKKRTLLVMPTGSGKTVVFNQVVKKHVNYGENVLSLAHRDELLQQAANNLSATTGIVPAFEKADMHSLDTGADVTIGSVQTMSISKRLNAFPSDYFGLIVVDEAHHILSPSYQKVLNHFPGAKVLGVTATPDRGDQRNLGRFFESKAFEYELPDAINDGYLCPIKAQMIPVCPDLSRVKSSCGDYSADSLGSAIDPYLERIADEMVAYKGRKIMVFLPLVETSKRFASLLNSRGFNAAEINGKSPDRRQILADYHEGKIDVLCNAMLLTEGFDEPSVDCIVILRPTKIRSLYSQMCGRGTRICEGKNELLLLDFLWLTDKHSLCKPSSLICRDEETAKHMDKLLERGEGLDIMEAAARAERNVCEEREQALAAKLAELRRRRSQYVDVVQYSLSIFDESIINYKPVFDCDRKKPSNAQLQWLELHGISGVSSSGQAELIISKLKARAAQGLTTPKQIRCLERYGFTRVGTWQFNDAASMISRISGNNWNLPYGIVPGRYRP